MLEYLSNNMVEAATQAKAVGEKILSCLNQPYHLATHELRGSASIGIAIFNNQYKSQEDIIKHADIAMYQAKKSGRNALRFFDPKMQDVINAHVSLESDLRKALEKKQFHLYYQVQMNENQHPTGAEGLIRWIHPERGLVPPLEFIPLAEETGLILPIGQWVMETACEQLKVWERDALTRELTISINVSAKQFFNKKFVMQVQSIIQHHSINPMLLKLELTESVLLGDIEQTIITMIALQAIGVRFELDDFGTGYSSLQYLKQLPLEQLKIDQSFVHDIVTDNSDKAIVCAIIAMAQSLNLKVIAEGVETKQQKLFLLEKGCHRFQGYFFGKPMPIEQFELVLREGKLH
jgi:EAL domain-containing protein (putative c-di-GMP-specific phosphodiesterase class I)